MTTTSLREIAGTIQSQHTVEGGGFNVRRPFPTAKLDQIDPFLLLDEMGPAEYAHDVWVNGSRRFNGYKSSDQKRWSAVDDCWLWSNS